MSITESALLFAETAQQTYPDNKPARTSMLLSFLLGALFSEPDAEAIAMAAGLHTDG